MPARVCMCLYVLVCAARACWRLWSPVRLMKWQWRFEPKYTDKEHIIDNGPTGRGEQIQFGPKNFSAKQQDFAEGIIGLLCNHTRSKSLLNKRAAEGPIQSKHTQKKRKRRENRWQQSLSRVSGEFSVSQRRVDRKSRLRINCGFFCGSMQTKKKTVSLCRNFGCPRGYCGFEYFKSHTLARWAAVGKCGKLGYVIATILQPSQLLKAKQDF